LIAAAYALVYRRGVARTSLADIAQAADVPVGDVYYYFKTKDDIKMMASGSGPSARLASSDQCARTVCACTTSGRIRPPSTAAHNAKPDTSKNGSMHCARNAVACTAYPFTIGDNTI
jgi:hypothetical protein